MSPINGSSHAPQCLACLRRYIAPLVIAIALLWTASARAQDAAADFKTNCTSCHTIGGGVLTGPDLKDVTTRQDRAWLRTFVRNPKSIIDGGDPHAQQLFKDARGVIMPTLANMTDARISALLDLIEAESKLPKSQFAGTQVSDRPFTPADIERGRSLFIGRSRLMAGGPACISCHTTGSMSGLGGGRLGPDLTKAFERLGGRKGLSVWLSSPATPTMQSVFGKRALDADEILSLVSLFDLDARTQTEAASNTSTFLPLGLAGALGMLFGLNRLWGGRLRSVRRELLVRRARLVEDAHLPHAAQAHAEAEHT
jgi:mono/diheme cytochrome c family protein